MMLARFLVLLLLTGGSAFNHSELLDDQQKFNQSSDESGSTSSHSELQKTPKLLHDQQMSHHRSDKHGKSPECQWGYQGLLNYLNLTKNNEMYTLTRPVIYPQDVSYVWVDMSIYAILDVNEIDQKLTSYIWVYVSWSNEYISWYPNDFCGIEQIVVPSELLWKPDLIIEEMTEKAIAPPSPYLTIRNFGEVILRNDQVVVSTCRMQVYSFPFDTQHCSLSFKSAVYSDKEIQLTKYNYSDITERSRDLMQTHYEWLFINMNVSEETNNRYGFQRIIVYTITMKRRSLLYIVTFILPVLFFLCLDLASFMISDDRGEKLTFKIIVLLAVTVMQLILNKLLPSSSDKAPLIAVYSIGIFGLMMLSLLETIFVLYLMDKDSKGNKAEKDQSLSEDCEDKQGKISFHNGFRDEKKWAPYVSVCGVSADETLSEPLLVAKEPQRALLSDEGTHFITTLDRFLVPPSQSLAPKRYRLDISYLCNKIPLGGSSTKLAEESPALEKISEDLRQMEKTLSVVFNSREGEVKPGYWTRVAQTFNKIFFICYVTVSGLFLITIFSVWKDAADDAH